MKSRFLWIGGAILVVFALLNNKTHNATVEPVLGEPPQVRYQLESNEQQVIAPIDASLDFKGYPCTIDCSGHEAGYKWAEEKDIDDPDDCGGNSESFIEGCQAYAKEQQIESDEDSNDE